MPKLNEKVKVVLIQITIFCFLLFLLIAGIELRHWYKYKIKFPPNGFAGATAKKYTWGHKVRNNRWGLRERDFDTRTLHQDDRFVVLVLGDSYTWGQGLGEAQRYSNLLEEYLRTEYPSRKSVVLNFARQGWPTTTERDTLRNFYQAIKPDLVIVGFCYNDPLGPDHARKAVQKEIQPVTSVLKFLRLHGTAKATFFAYMNIMRLLKRVENWRERLMKVYRKDSKEWQDFEKALADIRAMTAEVTVNPPILISLNGGAPDRNRLPTDYNHPDPLLRLYLSWHHQAESAAHEAGFITTNCEEEMKQFKNYIMAVTIGEDGHPTAEMNKVYAQKLFSIIKEYKFVEK